MVKLVLAVDLMEPVPVVAPLTVTEERLVGPD